MTLNTLNDATADDAKAAFIGCCASNSWADTMTRSRPFASIEEVIAKSRKFWGAVCDSDRLEAFAAHPLIGDVDLLRARFAESEDRANAEQGQVLAADEAVIRKLADQNVRYRDRHGFIFIVFASGKSAQQMLVLLEARIDRSTEDEMMTAAEEQQKITELRLRSLLSDSP